MCKCTKALQRLLLTMNIEEVEVKNIHREFALDEECRRG